MFKRFIPFLSLVMTISFIVFVGLQLYFLREIIKDGDKNFTTQVKVALEEVSRKSQIKEVEDYYKIFGNFYNEASSKKNIFTRQVVQAVVDSGDYRYISYKNYLIEKKSTPIPLSKGDTLEKTNLYTDEGILKVERGSEEVPVTTLTNEKEDSIINGSFSLTQFAKLNNDEKPVNQRVSVINLKKLIEEEFKLRNIDIDYKIGVLDDSLEMTKVVDKEFKFDKESNKNYFSVLFKDKNENPKYYLSIYMPSKGFSMFKPYLGAIGMTLLSTLIIIFIYSTSIRYMSRQKKISEIKTDFINNMSHEFKTPIATISVATDALKNKMINSNPEKVIHYSNLIKQENSRMNKQVELVLRMSKLERNKLEFQEEEIPILPLIQKLIGSYSLLINDRNGTIIEDYYQEEVLLKVDEFHLSNALINLLDNANKYSPEAPQIKIKTFVENENYIIEVSDKGIGMNEENIKKIFEKFYRVERGNIHDVKGHGLGLAYVKSIIEKHNGSVEVNSEVGEGSTFKIMLPLIKNI